jgi:hypothetical protein
LEDQSAELALQLSEARQMSAQQREEIQELKSQLYSLQQMTPYPRHAEQPRQPHDQSAREERMKGMDVAAVQKKINMRAEKVGLDCPGGVAGEVDAVIQDDEDYPPDHDSESESHLPLLHQQQKHQEELGGKEDELLKEIHELHEINLLYEKENERMVSIILDKDAEIKTIKSEFFDKRDSWIKEINRLSNHQQTSTSLPPPSFHPHTPSQQTSSYHQFQTKLATESEVFYLQERIDELEKLCTQQENQLTLSEQRLHNLEREKLILMKNIENLKKQLLQSANFLPRMSLQDTPPPPPFGALPVDEETTTPDDSGTNRKVFELEKQLQEERSKYLLQIQELSSRLKWYSTTQERLDLVTRERDQFKAMAQHPNSPSRNDSQSVISVSTSRRNPQDIKRIK